MKRTEYSTYEYGRSRRVYEDENGNLFFRKGGAWFGTFPEYCEKDNHEADWVLKNAQ
jgi:hypothetical protein